MKKRNLLTLSILSALAFNVTADTNLIVKPIGEYANGVDIGGGYKRVTIDTDNAQVAVMALKNSGLFTSVELDTVVSKPRTLPKKTARTTRKIPSVSAQIAGPTDDPYFNLQEYLKSSSVYINGTNLQEAAEYLKEVTDSSGDNVRVLVVDGDFYENQEIPYAGGYSFVKTGLDGTGFTNPNFYASAPAGQCSDEHGTSVASIYGAIRDNGSSIAGAAPNIAVVAAEALVCNDGFISDVVSAMYWGMGEKVGEAVNIPTPVNVINLSLGAEFDTCSSAFQNAINLAKSRGIQVHVSAGNASIDASGNTPSNCENVMVTGALNKGADSLADFTNTGDTVDIYAQGVDILGLDAVEGSVSTWSGTSFSVPLTGATGALLKSFYPAITPEQVYWFIGQGSRILSESPTCFSGNCEKGQLDALAAATRAHSYFTQENTTIKPVLAAGEACLSGYVGTYFAEKKRLCGLFEVSFESQTDKNGITYQLHATPIAGGDAFVVVETPEISVITRDIDLQNFSYSYSVCTNGDCVASPLNFAVDTTTPVECQ